MGGPRAVLVSSPTSCVLVQRYEAEIPIWSIRTEYLLRSNPAGGNWETCLLSKQGVRRHIFTIVLLLVLTVSDESVEARCNRLVCQKLKVLSVVPT